MTEHATGQKVQEYPRIDEVTADTLFEAFKNGYKSATAQQIADFTGGGGGGTSNGIELLTSGTISSPVAYIDFPLMSQYARSLLCFETITFSAGSDLSILTSFDDGVTFVADLDNGDSYLVETLYLQYPSIATGSIVSPAVSYTYPNATAELFDTFAASYDAQCVIYPGGGSNFFRFSSSCYGLGVNSGVTQDLRQQNECSMNVGAVVTPTLSRATTIRLVAGQRIYHGTDINLLSGSYTFWGMT